MSPRRIIRTVLVALATLVPPAAAQFPTPATRKVLEPHGVERFPPLYLRALDTLLESEDFYRSGRYAEASELLAALWSDHPPSSAAWVGLRSPTDEFFTGSPPCYYALRMLSTCTAWRLRPAPPAHEAPHVREVVLTVVLVGAAQGVEPRTRAELDQGGGAAVNRVLDSALLAGDRRIVHQSLWLLGEYVRAITDGRLAPRTEIVGLPNLCLPVGTAAQPLRSAGLADGALDQVWEALPQDVLDRTDWWWVLYPSHVPERHPDFARTEFITGGMAVGPDGGSPCFLIDDRWLVRKPPHLGLGPWTDVERRAYLPQWLLHEFAHHLFRTWPGFGLEARDHQWFDRSTWPPDFVGSLEPDYIVEAVERRLRPRAEPPLHVALRYAPAPRELLAELPIEALCGRYVHEPRQNDWHEGLITATGQRRAGVALLRWRNQAGVTWELMPDLSAGVLRTGPDNPYDASTAEREHVFRLVPRRDASGDFLPELEGFRFLGGLYRRVD